MLRLLEVRRVRVSNAATSKRRRLRLDTKPMPIQPVNLYECWGDSSAGQPSSTKNVLQPVQVSSATRFTVPVAGGIASTSHRFGSFAVMIACAASITLPLCLAKHIPAPAPIATGKFNRRRHALPAPATRRTAPAEAAYVITPFVSFTGFIIANSFPPIDLSAAQNRTYVLHASVSATCVNFNSIAHPLSVHSRWESDRRSLIADLRSISFFR